MRIENSYEFQKRYCRVHNTIRNWKEKTPDADELVIGKEVTICLNCDSPVAKTAEKDFSAFLKTAFGFSAKLVTKDGDLEISIDPAMTDYMSRKITVGDKGIIITAADDRGIAQAFYDLENQMTDRKAPFLKKGITEKKPLFSPRMVHSGYGLDEFPDEYLNTCAHHGFDAILVYVAAPDLSRPHLKAPFDFSDLIRRAAKYGIDVYKTLNKRQQRYVKNYKALKSAYDLASDLNDERIATAMQERVNALKDLFPLTLDNEPEVIAVRADFDAMTGSQKLLVDAAILKDAEEQIAVLRAEFVKYVETLIQALPEVVTLEAEAAIMEARAAMDKLYAPERKQVSFAKLDQAEFKLRTLLNGKAAAENVDMLIKNIGIVTLGDKARIAEAKRAYSALDEVGRSFCTKANKLKRAEFILKALQSWGIPAIAIADAGIIFAVIWFVPSLHKKVFKTKKKEEEPSESE